MAIYKLSQYQVSCIEKFGQEYAKVDLADLRQYEVSDEIIRRIEETKIDMDLRKNAYCNIEGQLPAQIARDYFKIGYDMAYQLCKGLFIAIINSYKGE